MLIYGFNKSFIMFILNYVNFCIFFRLNFFFGISVSGLSSTKIISLISFNLTSSSRLFKIHCISISDLEKKGIIALADY